VESGVESRRKKKREYVESDLTGSKRNGFGAAVYRSPPR
jgi:hypothetical protein